MLAIGDEEAIYFGGDVFKGLFSPQLDLDKTTSQMRRKVTFHPPGVKIHTSCHHNDVLTWKGFREQLRRRYWICSYLYGHHGQHLHRDPVKFIKATPCPRLSQAFVDVPTGLVDRERQRQIFRWTQRDKSERRASQVETLCDWRIRRAARQTQSLSPIRQNRGAAGWE